MRRVCLLSGVERFPLLGGFQCTNFNERAIGTGNNVSYIYRGGLLLGGSVNRGSTVYTYVRTYMYVGRFLKSLRKKFQDKLARHAPLSIAAAQKREPGTLCTRMRKILLEIK